MATLIVKHETVFVRQDDLNQETAVCYGPDPDDFESGSGQPRMPFKYIFLPTDLVEEMGNPETVIVTVEPGDKLNEPEGETS